MLSRNAARGGAVRTASKCDKARYNTVVNGIAIVDAFYAEDINGCLRQRPCTQTLEDTLLLVNGEKPTFVSYACRHQRNTRQQAEHNRRMRLKAIGVPVPVHKCADRLRLEREGAILVMDGYVSRHEECRVTSISQAYRAHFPSRPPSPDRTAPRSKRLSRVTKYLVDEAVLGHRPIFERVPSSEVYGEGYEYMTSTQALADAEVTAVLDACSRVTKVCEPCAMSDGDDVPTAEIPSGPSVDSTYDLEYGALWSPATIRGKMDVADDEAGQLHARDLCRVSA